MSIHGRASQDTGQTYIMDIFITVNASTKVNSITISMISVTLKTSISFSLKDFAFTVNKIGMFVNL
jgi:hypothetical protein